MEQGILNVHGTSFQRKRLKASTSQDISSLLVPRWSSSRPVRPFLSSKRVLGGSHFVYKRAFSLSRCSTNRINLPPLLEHYRAFEYLRNSVVNRIRLEFVTKCNIFVLLTSCAGTTCHARRKHLAQNCNILSVLSIYYTTSGILKTQAKQIMNLLVIFIQYPVYELLYIRFGHSLWSANQLLAQRG